MRPLDCNNKTVPISLGLAFVQRFTAWPDGANKASGNLDAEGIFAHTLGQEQLYYQRPRPWTDRSTFCRLAFRTAVCRDVTNHSTTEIHP